MTALPDASWRKRFRQGLLRWYERNKRDLPWRRTDDPYAIWLSEIMLQQTTVPTVERRFAAFLDEFPTIAALAAADERAVLRAWEGLGYYRRARQLHQAAREIVQRHGGAFPRQLDTIRSLPGIGRYTAGAIASIAFDTPAPILEANTQRLFARLLAFRGDPSSTAGQRRLWSMAEAVLPRRHAGTLNQALMELGSLICTPRDPICAECPVAALCRANELGLQASIPKAKPKQRLTPLDEVALVVQRRGRVLLVECADGGRWAGLWDFLRFPKPKPHSPERIAVEARRRGGVEVELGQHLGTIHHGVTRYRIRLDAYRAAALAVDPPPEGVVRKWLLPRELERYPLSTTGRKLARMLD